MCDAESIGGDRAEPPVLLNPSRENKFSGVNGDSEVLRIHFPCSADHE